MKFINKSSFFYFRVIRASSIFKCFICSNNSFLTQLSPQIEISELNNNNEIIKVLKVSGENEIIEPKTYNHFRFELIDYDNISKQNTNEFSAKLSSEKLILQIW